MVDFCTLEKNIKYKSKINKILIIGKGTTIEKLISMDFSKYFVINLNDSHKFYKGDVILVNKLWALNDINKIKKKIILILDKNIEYRKSHPNLYRVNFSKYRIHKNLNEKISKFFSSKNCFYDPLFLSSIKLSYLIAKSIKKKLEVDMIGFDFKFKSPSNYSAFSLVNNNNKFNFKNAKKEFEVQKKILQKISSLNNKYIKINHVGNLKFSKINILKFAEKNVMLKTHNNINNTEIVAEITTNHHGNFENLIKMAKLSKDAGADYVKIQKRDVINFYSPQELKNPYFSQFGKTFKDYRMGLELSMEEIDKFDKYCKQININWFCSVLDVKSFHDILKFKPTMIKIPSTVSGHSDLHKEVSKLYKKKIIVSTGFTNEKYQSYVLNMFKKNEKIYLLQCTSSYPARLDDCNIAVIKNYDFLSRNDKKIVPGFSSHDPGSLGCIMAIAAGAKLLEKHVKFKDVKWGHFDSVALNLGSNEFKNFVKEIRKSEILIGSEIKKISPNEYHKYTPRKL